LTFVNGHSKWNNKRKLSSLSSTRLNKNHILSKSTVLVWENHTYQRTTWSEDQLHQRVILIRGSDEKIIVKFLELWLIRGTCFNKAVYNLSTNHQSDWTKIIFCQSEQFLYQRNTLIRRSTSLEGDSYQMFWWEDHC